MEINYKLGYYTKVNESINLTLIGTEVVDKNIELNDGWNLIGYPYLEEKNISKLFGNVTVYSYNNSQWYSYNPANSLNTLNSFKPSYGYWIKSI